jgi:hypothetical protein
LHITSATRADPAVWLAASVPTPLLPSNQKINTDFKYPDPDFFPGMTCLNVRMLDGVDLKALKIKFADGRSYAPGGLAEGTENEEWKKVA